MDTASCGHTIWLAGDVCSESLPVCLLPWVPSDTTTVVWDSDSRPLMRAGCRLPTWEVIGRSMEEEESQVAGSHSGTWRSHWTLPSFPGLLNKVTRTGWVQTTGVFSHSSGAGVCGPALTRLSLREAEGILVAAVLGAPSSACRMAPISTRVHTPSHLVSMSSLPSSNKDASCWVRATPPNLPQGDLCLT